MFVGCVVEENAAIQQYINSDDILRFEDHVVFSFIVYIARILGNKPCK